MVKRMWNISARQKRRSSRSIISIHLRKRKRLILDLLPQLKEKVQQVQPKQELKDYLKRNETSLNFSKTIPMCDKFFFRKFWITQMTQTMKQLVLQPHPPNQSNKIIKIHKILMIFDLSNEKKIKIKSLQKSCPFGISKGRDPCQK